MKYDYVLFDFDGTLADTANGVFSSACYAMNKMYEANHTLNEVKDFLGPPLLESFLKRGYPEEDFPIFTKLYSDYYDSESIRNTYFYDGAEDSLERLNQAGIRVGIASTKTIPAIEKIFKLRNMSHLVEVICATETVGEVVTKESMIENALTALNVTDRSRACMVGDRYLDAYGAQVTGLDFYAMMCSGLTPCEEFNDYSINGMFYSLTELTDYLLK